MPLWSGGGAETEIQDLGYEISCVEDGRVTFYGGRRGNCGLEYVSAQCRTYSAEGRCDPRGDV